MNTSIGTARSAWVVLIAVVAFCLAPLTSEGADLDLRLENAPNDGTLVFQVYDAADAFGDLRDPVQEFSLPAVGDGVYALKNVSDGETTEWYITEYVNGCIPRHG